MEQEADLSSLTCEQRKYSDSFLAGILEVWDPCLEEILEWEISRLVPTRQGVFISMELGPENVSLCERCPLSEGVCASFNDMCIIP